MTLPRLALVPGEPAGIGPELCVRLAQRPRRDCTLDRLRRSATRCRGRRRLLAAAARLAAQAPARNSPAISSCIRVPNAAPAASARPIPRNAHAVIDALLAGAQGCLDGDFDGLVTGPVHKATINAGGIAYTGTTELLARQASSDVVMMLANAIVRVALATTHLPLRAVPDAITARGRSNARCASCIAPCASTSASARRCIAVLGLNPHAGEDGHLGTEERDVIAPLLDTLRAEGMRLLGPLPADTAFLPAKLREASTRCSRCTTTRACPCSSSAASNRR